MTDYQKERVEGAIWEKQDKNGARYMSGFIEIDGTKTEIVLFQNTRKKGNQPDWRILESKRLPKAETPAVKVEEKEEEPPF